MAGLLFYNIEGRGNSQVKSVSLRVTPREPFLKVEKQPDEIKARSYRKILYL